VLACGLGAVQVLSAELPRAARACIVRGTAHALWAAAPLPLGSAPQLQAASAWERAWPHICIDCDSQCLAGGAAASQGPAASWGRLGARRRHPRRVLQLLQPAACAQGGRGSGEFQHGASAREECNSVNGESSQTASLRNPVVEIGAPWQWQALGVSPGHVDMIVM